jgi:hypothetical protein
MQLSLPFALETFPLHTFALLALDFEQVALLCAFTLTLTLQPLALETADHATAVFPSSSAWVAAPAIVAGAAAVLAHGRTAVTVGMTVRLWRRRCCMCRTVPRRRHARRRRRRRRRGWRGQMMTEGIVSFALAVSRTTRHLGRHGRVRGQVKT